MDSLATFYEACAQIEIDEYRDYEKALQAMREAARHAAKIKGDDDGRDMRVAAINNRIGIVETFVRAHSLIRSAGEGPQQALGLCGQLLQAIPAETGDLEGGIRVGDVYALMVEYWWVRGLTSSQELIHMNELMSMSMSMSTPQCSATHLITTGSPTGASAPSACRWLAGTCVEGNGGGAVASTLVELRAVLWRRCVCGAGTSSGSRWRRTS